MPLYPFESTDGRYQEIYYPMAEVPRIGETIDIEGAAWKRVPLIPNASSNAQTYDPNSSKDFNRRFDGKNVTLGDMMDASKEASQQRAGTTGGDHLKQRYYDDYAKQRHGKRHSAERKEQTDKAMSDLVKTVKKAAS